MNAGSLFLATVISAYASMRRRPKPQPEVETPTCGPASDVWFAPGSRGFAAKTELAIAERNRNRASGVRYQPRHARRGNLSLPAVPTRSEGNDRWVTPTPIAA